MEKKVLVDTDILIDAFQEDPETILLLNKIEDKNIFISSITYMELCRGARNKAELKTIGSKLKGYTLLNISELVSLKAVELIQNFHLSHGLQIPDALIGSSAIVFDLPILTNNEKDFKYMPGIRLYLKSAK